ncbi:MAG: transketolase, partial [Oscillospiraceae bacterium]|nr:transketolase [Oscillospiraceae bacterium]
AVILSSGRQVHESLVCAEALGKAGLAVGVVDMPSIDEKALLELYDSGKTLVIAEQNNGFIYINLMKTLFKNKRAIDANRVIAINTTGKDFIPHYIHSGTYEELTDAYGLNAAKLTENLKTLIK